MNTLPHSRLSSLRTALLASALLCVSATALAQVGRYDSAQVREHHKKVDKTAPGEASDQLLPQL